MSADASGWAWELAAQHGLTAECKLILLCVAEYTDSAGWVVLDLPSMSKQVGMSLARLERGVLQLVKLGLVSPSPSWSLSPTEPVHISGPRYEQRRQLALPL